MSSEDRVETFLTEAVILALLATALVCAVLGRVLAEWFRDYSVDLVLILAGRRGLKGITQVIAERGRTTFNTTPAPTTSTVNVTAAVSNRPPTEP